MTVARDKTGLLQWDRCEGCGVLTPSNFSYCINCGTYGYKKDYLQRKVKSAVLFERWNEAYDAGRHKEADKLWDKFMDSLGGA